MKVLQALEILNRRAKSMQSLFGTQSEVFQKWSTQMTRFDVYTNAKGFLQLSRNKANKAQYRQLIAWAKREQKTPYSVIKRKAVKYQKEVKQMFDDDDTFDDSEFINIDVYNKFLADCATYFESCYNIAVMEDADNVYERAEYLYFNRPEYIRAWNDLYRAGVFDEYKQQYEYEQFKQTHIIDDNGEIFENPDFYETF